MIDALIEVGLHNDLLQILKGFNTGNMADMKQHDIVDYLQSNPDLAGVVFHGVDLSNISGADLFHAIITLVNQ
jgi:hypothetical protein